MASLDWSQCPAVESIPGKVSGAWVFTGTRTPVAIVFENLEDGMTINEVVEQFAVTREQVKRAPNIELQGDELSRADESALYHHYELNYTPPDTESGRRLARR